MSNSVATDVTKDSILPQKRPCVFPTRDSKKPPPPAEELLLIKELQFDPFKDQCLLNDFKQCKKNSIWDFYQSMINPPAEQYLMRDFKMLKLHPPTGISASPQDGNIFLWDAVILGPEGTMWQGGIFKLTLQFPKRYRYVPPTVRFVTHVFHPNIDENGTINADFLNKNWSPTFDVADILTSIQSLLCTPNLSNTINLEAATMFTEHNHEYEKKAWKIVCQSWDD